MQQPLALALLLLLLWLLLLLLLLLRDVCVLLPAGCSWVLIVAAAGCCCFELRLQAAGWKSIVGIGGMGARGEALGDGLALDGARVLHTILSNQALKLPKLLRNSVSAIRQDENKPTTYHLVPTTYHLLKLIDCFWLMVHSSWLKER